MRPCPPLSSPPSAQLRPGGGDNTEGGASVCPTDKNARDQPGHLHSQAACSAYAPIAGIRGYSPGVPAGGIGMPPSEYSLSLLRNVRIEMPRMLAA
jgi:hypothetical protein